MASAASLVLLAAMATAFQVMPAKEGLVTMECPRDSHGAYGGDTVILSSVASLYPGMRVLVLLWRRRPSSEWLLSWAGTELVQQGRFQRARTGAGGNVTDVSLLIRDTRVADEGTYECLVVTNHGNAECSSRLRVTARYTGLTVTSVPWSNIQEDTTVEIFCSAWGGYPQGSILWFDQYGTNWSRSAEMQVQEMLDGRFSLTSKFSLWRASSLSPEYSCHLIDRSGEEQVQATIHLQFSQPARETVSGRWSNKGKVAMVVVLGSLLSGLALLMLFQEGQSMCRTSADLGVLDRDVGGDPAAESSVGEGQDGHSVSDEASSLCTECHPGTAAGTSAEEESCQ